MLASRVSGTVRKDEKLEPHTFTFLPLRVHCPSLNGHCSLTSLLWGTFSTYEDFRGKQINNNQNIQEQIRQIITLINICEQLACAYVPAGSTGKKDGSKKDTGGGMDTNPIIRWSQNQRFIPIERMFPANPPPFSASKIPQIYPHAKPKQMLGSARIG